MSDHVRSRRPKQLGSKVARYTLATQYPGQPGYSDAAPVVAHVRELVGLGLPARSIARVVGMHEESVQEIARHCRPQVRTRVADDLLRVTHHPIPAQERVIAIGACRRLRALCALGWTTGTLAARSTLSDKVLCSLTLGRQATTTYEIWAEVLRLFELLSGTPGPSLVARSRALAKGWWAPLDWEDLDIDDPRVEPAPRIESKITIRTIAAERREQVRGLADCQLTVQQIADRVGISERQAARYLAEIREEDAA